MTTPIVGLFLGIGTALFIAVLIAFRMAWSLPGAAKSGHLPKSWSRWILGEKSDEKR